jgi:hypothetical protein
MLSGMAEPWPMGADVVVVFMSVPLLLTLVVPFLASGVVCDRRPWRAGSWNTSNEWWLACGVADRLVPAPSV